ncbi:DUF1876 domain-containing protein [Streptomyces sp. AD55]|uniref:DUF1876 domain-containing protein n=1 Tax=Streptomyces sp. AD55 TaxID=3242895 RepID=UPI003527BC1D
MTHTLEWKVHLHLFEEGGTTKARAAVDTGTAVVTGHGVAHRNPVDPDVPEIGDELAAGRALHDLGRQLVDSAEHDLDGVHAPRPEPRPALGWPM